MMNFSEGVLSNAKGIYANAKSDFEKGEWGFAQSNAEVALGMAQLLTAYPETPKRLRVEGEHLLIQAKALAKQAQEALTKAQFDNGWGHVIVEKGHSGWNEVTELIRSAFRDAAK